MGYKEILYIDNLEGGGLQWQLQQDKHLVCQPTEPLANKFRQKLLAGYIQLGPM